ncbi:MAG: tetratricopeptide repeat protein [bacterium]
MKPIHTSRSTSYVLRPTSYILILFTVHFSLFTAFSQDRPTPQQPPRLLPFQQQAQPPTDEAQLAMQFFQAKDYAKAAELYEKLYKEKPSTNLYIYYLHSLIELKEYNKAEKLIKTQRKFEPKALKYLVDLGYIQFREGDGEKAKKLYDEALRDLLPDQQQIFELANAFILKGENAYAIQTYLKGRELLKGSYPFSFELANLYERTEDFTNLFGEYLNLLAFNESYVRTVQDRLQNLLINDPDNEKNEFFRKALLSRVQKYPDQAIYSDILWWYSIQQKDFELALLQAKALDRRRQEQGDRILQLAQLAVSNEQYKVALEAYKYLLGKGKAYPYYELSHIELANTRFLQVTSEPDPNPKELAELKTEILKVLETTGENGRSVTLMQHLAHLEAFYLGQSEPAEDLLYRAIELKDISPQSRALCKMELGDILLFFGDVWEATLLYQQVYQDFKYDVLGQTAKFKNTRLSFYIGEFAWAKAQADILKTATDKLIANDAIALSLLIGENYDPDSTTIALTLYAKAELLSMKNEEEQAIVLLDSIPLLFGYHPILDDILMKKAEIYEKTGEYAVADSLLHRITQEYGSDVLADRALFMRAVLQETKIGNRQLAMTLYGELIEKYPGSIYVVDARKRYRALRGDVVSIKN